MTPQIIYIIILYIKCKSIVHKNSNLLLLSAVLLGLVINKCCHKKPIHPCLPKQLYYCITFDNDDELVPVVLGTTNITGVDGNVYYQEVYPLVNSDWTQPLGGQNFIFFKSVPYTITVDGVEQSRFDEDATIFFKGEEMQFNGNYATNNTGSTSGDGTAKYWLASTNDKQIKGIEIKFQTLENG